MRRLLTCLVALSCFGGSPTLAQDKTSLPARFDLLAKNDRFRLLRVLGTPEMPPIHHQASAFSADGKVAVFAEDLSSAKPHLRTRLLQWDMPAKGWPREIDIDGKNVTALNLSADGSKALLAGQIIVGIKKEKKDKEETVVAEFGSYVGLWDLKTGKEIRVFSFKGSESATCVALSPDESAALAGGRDGVHRWNLKDGKLLGSYREKDAATAAMAVAWLPDGKRFLAGNWVSDVKRTGVVRLWDIAKKDPVRTFPAKGELGWIFSLAVSRDGKHFACGDTRPSVSLWETDTGKEVGMLHDEKHALGTIVTAVALADDNKTVLGVWSKFNAEPDDAAGARLIAFDAEGKKVFWSHLAAYRGTPPILVFGEKILVGGGPNLFDTWNIKDGKLLASWGAHKGTVNAIAALPGGDILSAGQEGIVMTWRQGEVAVKREAHKGAIGVMALSQDQKQWLTGGADHLVKLWTAGADQPVHVFKGHGAAITSLAFSKDGRWACSSAGDRAVKTWDLTTGKEIATLIGHSESVNAVAISPDESWLASASDDGTIRVWPIKDGKLDPDRESCILESHKKPVTCLAFSPNGKTLLSGSQDQTLKVWDWAKEKVVRTIPGHKNWVTSLLFIDDATVLSTSDDLSICMWEWESGKEIGRIDFGAVSDCPRCMTRLGSDRLLVGTSNWLIYELQMLPAAKSKKGQQSSEE